MSETQPAKGDKDIMAKGQKYPALTQEELAEKLALKGYTKRDAAVIWRDVTDVLIEAVAAGDEVCLRGFGIFYQRIRAGRRLPKAFGGGTPLPYPIPAVRWSPRLKEKVNPGGVTFCGEDE
jgi:nucleoid DNA-binding protein